MSRSTGTPISMLLPLPRGLKVTSICESPDGSGVLVYVSSTRRRAACPSCSKPSRHIHSRYCRTPADLPCVGRPIRLMLNVRRFFCKRATCPRKIFTERLPKLLESSSRLTTRLRSALQKVGFACGGKGGERLTTALGMGVSDTTLLGSIQLARTPSVNSVNAAQVRVVGIDDWSWQKGKSYGTIIVDLERKKVLDLLPDRNVETVRAWLAAHPQVEIVSRDRGGCYVDGATQGAPQAVQVADRWHLYKNLGEAVEAFFVRTRVRIQDDVPTPPACGAMGISETMLRPPISATPQRQQQSQAHLYRKWKLHERIHLLCSEGMSLHQIVREVGLARNTVRKYARQPVPSTPPKPTPRPRRQSVLNPYEAYLLRRWNEECGNSTLLLKEIRQQGYRGGLTVLKDYMRYLRKHPAQTAHSRPRQHRAASVSPRELRWLLARQSENLDEEQQSRLQRLLAVSTDVQLVHALLQSFHVMLRQKQHERLNCWLEHANKSGIPEMKSFALGIRRDYEAVKAAIVLPWSQGQTEGQVNKLKTLKRAMYGRAGFPLLRQRVLHSNGGPAG